MKKIYVIFFLVSYCYFAKAQAPCGYVNAGPDFTDCYKTDLITQLKGQVTEKGSVQWSSSGSGKFINKDSLFASYQSTPQDYAKGKVFLYLTNKGNGSCIPTTDTLILAYGITDPIKIKRVDQICSDTIHLEVEVSESSKVTWYGNGGTFLPDMYSKKASYVLGYNDIYSAGFTQFRVFSTNNNACPGSDTLDVLGQSNSIEAGTNQHTCDSLVHLKGQFVGNRPTLWTTHGSGTFKDGAAGLDAVYSPSPADYAKGRVRLDLTVPASGYCKGFGDSVMVEFGHPSIQISTKNKACQDSIAVDYKVSDGTQVLWTTNGSYQIFDESIAGRVTYGITPEDRYIKKKIYIIATTKQTTSCNAVADTLVLLPGPHITINAGQDLHVPSGNSVQISGAVEPAGTPFSWKTSGSGTFANPHSLQTIYQASASDREKGWIVLSLTTDSSTYCDALSAYFKVDFSPQFAISGRLTKGDSAQAKVLLFKNTSGEFILDTSGVFNTTYFFKRDPGEYIVLAQPIFAYYNYIPTYATGKPDWTTATRFITTNKDIYNADIDFLLGSSTNTWSGKDTIAGQISVSELTDNKRISAVNREGISVILFNENGQPLTFTTTDAQGKFTFSGIASGTYNLKIDYPQLLGISKIVILDGDPKTLTSVNLNTQKESVEGTFDSEKGIHSLSFFPNPVKDVLTIRMPSSVGSQFKVTIFETTGKLLLSKEGPSLSEFLDLDMGFLSQGCYILELNDGLAPVRKSFIKIN